MKYDFGVPLYQIDLDEEVNDGNEGEPRRRIDTFVIEGEKTGQEVWAREHDAKVGLKKVRAVCSEREWEILWAYFVHGQPMEDIGKSQKVCRERVRQLIRKVRMRMGKRDTGNFRLRGVAG